MSLLVGGFDKPTSRTLWPCDDRRATTRLMADADQWAARAGVTEALVELAARPLDVPAALIAAARRAFVDTIGVLIAGRREPAVAIVAGTLASGDDAKSLATSGRFRAEDAAMLDGVAAHMLDYDDVALHGHPSVVIVPALLAEAQRIGASGRDMLAAYVIGYEAWALVGRCESDAYHLGSWHPTPTIGIVAATTAVAALGRLDPIRTRHALGLAASFASGIIANFGTPAKPLQAGRAAAGAIQAARLAHAGLGSAADAIDGRHGLLRGLSPHGRIDLTAPPAALWQLLEHGLSVKRYPVCYASHRAIDGLLQLADDHALEAADVRAITVSLGPAPAATLRYARPATGTEARFSLHHNLAAALVDRAVGFAQLTDAYVLRPDVAALYALTYMDVGGEPCGEQPGLAKHDRVRVETVGGRRLDSGPIRYPRGHASNPIDDAQLDAKFVDCARQGGVAAPDAFLARLHAVADIADMREAGLW